MENEPQLSCFADFCLIIPGPFNHTLESRTASEARHPSTGVIQKKRREIRGGIESTGFGSVYLESNAKLTPINAKQFLQSLINNMENRLSFEGEMLCDLSILATTTGLMASCLWPECTWHMAW
ncbi:hypothetical protein N1851_030937 [Merluccius polli]|uniref:Uncharacterized protein n=1 Tax=Merluccius polli TaxID=89951 RepID=A0AA47NQF5_MERPO|nr:hypothetical protein N1851_030937 [Merluccius polli]